MNSLQIIPAILVLIIGTQFTQAQVGIGTSSPSAELEIVGSDTGIPVLELTPQSAPTGNTTGQLAVIGDLLYMYDDTRGKWLSVESTTFQFGKNGNTNSQNLEFGGAMVSGSSGPLMPFDGTIVAITANSSGGTSTKEFQVRVRNGTTNISSTSFNLSSNIYNNSSLNIDFSAGDYITTRARDNSDGNVSNPGIVVWIKWRK